MRGISSHHYVLLLTICLHSPISTSISTHRIYELINAPPDIMRMLVEHENGTKAWLRMTVRSSPLLIIGGGQTASRLLSTSHSIIREARIRGSLRIHVQVVWCERENHNSGICDGLRNPVFRPKDGRVRGSAGNPGTRFPFESEMKSELTCKLFNSWLGIDLNLKRSQTGISFCCRFCDSRRLSLPLCGAFDRRQDMLLLQMVVRQTLAPKDDDVRLEP